MATSAMRAEVDTGSRVFTTSSFFNGLWGAMSQVADVDAGVVLSLITYPISKHDPFNQVSPGCILFALNLSGKAKRKLF